MSEEEGTNRINIGLVGVGGIGQVHADILSKDERVNLAGIVDVDEKRASILSRKYGCNSYTDYKRLLQLPSLDAIYVTVPNAFHANIVLQSIQKGISVFSEKPMATNFDEAKKIYEEVEKTGIIYQIGFNKRFAPLYKKVKDILNQKERPPLAWVKMNRGELKNPPWAGDPEISGGFLYETAMHILDILRFFFGEVRGVKCIAKSNVYSAQLDDFIIILNFENETIVSMISSGHTTWMYPYARIEIYGDHWSIETQEFDIIRYCPGLEASVLVEDFSLLKREEKRGYLQEDANFVEALIEKKTPLVTHSDGFRAMEIVEACYKSAKEEKEVILPL